MTDNAKIVEETLGDWGQPDYQANYEEVEDPYFYVIGLDPGETTGVAIVRVDTQDSKKLPEVIYLDQVPDGHYGFYDYFAPFYIGENAQVVSEWWVEHNVKGANREPLVIQGVEHALWDDRNVAQQAPDMKQLVSDEWLEEQGVWTPGKRHQMDALIHAIVFLRNDGHEGTVNALGGEGDGSTMGDAGEPQQGNGENPSDDLKASLAQLARELSEGQGSGSATNQDEATENAEIESYVLPEPEGKRKERELGGAFFGFESAEAGGEETSLLDD